MNKSLKNGFAALWVLVIIAVLAVAGAGYYVLGSNKDDKKDVATQQTPSINPAPSQQPSDTPKTDAVKETEKKGTTITTSNSQFGEILFDGKGQAIYIWEVEKSATAECYGDCAVAWPPVLTDGAPAASGQIKADLLGTATRTDGTTQVTYNGKPLYYYAHEKPGEVKCHNVKTHGGLWWVVKPDGNRVS